MEILFWVRTIVGIILALGLFFWLCGIAFGKREISFEVQRLINAINNDSLEYVETCSGQTVIGMYGKVAVIAYKANTGFMVNLDDDNNCLPRHEAKAVYRAMKAFERRHLTRERRDTVKSNKAIVSSKLGLK